MTDYLLQFDTLERCDCADACEDAIGLIVSAREVFTFLHYGLADGCVDRSDPAIAAICKMSALALEHEVNRLDPILDRLETRLRSARPLEEASHADQS